MEPAARALRKSSGLKIDLASSGVTIQVPHPAQPAPLYLGTNTNRSMAVLAAISARIAAS